MNLLVVGCSFKTAPIELREKLALPGERLPAALRELDSRFDVEAAVLSTCNRVEIYLARPDVSSGMPDLDAVAAFLASQIRFGEIPRLISAACAVHEPQPATSLDAVMAADQWAREFITQRIKSNER